MTGRVWRGVFTYSAFASNVALGEPSFDFIPGTGVWGLAAIAWQNPARRMGASSAKICAWTHARWWTPESSVTGAYTSNTCMQKGTLHLVISNSVCPAQSCHVQLDSLCYSLSSPWGPAMPDSAHTVCKGHDEPCILLNVNVDLCGSCTRGCKGIAERPTWV